MIHLVIVVISYTQQNNLKGGTGKIECTQTPGANRSRGGKVLQEPVISKISEKDYGPYLKGIDFENYSYDGSTIACSSDNLE